MDTLQAQSTVTAELGADERLLWSGAPSPARAAIAAIPAALFGVPFTLFAVLWIGTAWAATERGHLGGAWAYFPLFGTPFVVIGVVTMLAPLWAALAARGSAYGVTDRRIVFVDTRGRVRARSLLPADLGEIQRIDHRDGTGTLRFVSPAFARSNFARQYATAQTSMTGIADPRTVEQLVREYLVPKRAA